MKVFRRLLRRLGLPVLLSAVVASAAHAADSVYADAGDQARLDELAACAAYFFIAARAAELSQFERSYRAGEFSYNLLVMTLGREAAEERFNAANERVVDSMAGDWTRFEQLREQYGQRCRRLEERAASEAEAAAGGR